ncbi:MAG TPA: maleylpyruvate isomerase family mycothiol-dependent enzyme [Acidimicrobiia bacterium]|nr:maleylpyruvate isomerase family mycothiol-dependent enzyme [Acidimicrobiia bacterium]
MNPEAHLTFARDAGERIAAVGPHADLSVTVPSCPDWTLDALLFHTGGFCRFARLSLEQGATVEPGGLPHLDYSDYSPGDNVGWHRMEFDRLIAVLEASDPDEIGWSWGRDQRKAFWFRRAAQELSMHCWDAENAAGVAAPIDPELAADGVDEVLDEFGRPPSGLNSQGLAEKFGRPGATLHFHASDVREHPGEWTAVASEAAFSVTHEHSKGDVGARGTASDLLLFVSGRVPLDRLEVFGDRALLEHWAAEVKI